MFFIHACKEEVQKYDAELELRQSSFHLDGGLCVGKYRKYGSLKDKPYEWTIKLYSCHDSLPGGTKPRYEFECDYGIERKQIDCQQKNVSYPDAERR
jgi:hypothetical protein